MMTVKMPNRNYVMAAQAKAIDKDKVMLLYSGFLYEVGTLADIVYGQVKDLYDEISQYPAIYKFGVKRSMKATLKYCATIADTFKFLTNLDGIYADWLDITDMLEDGINSHLQKMFYATENLVATTLKEPRKVYARLILAYNLSAMLGTYHDGYLRVIHEDLHSMYSFPAGISESIPAIDKYLKDIYNSIVPEDVKMISVTHKQEMFGWYDAVHHYICDFSNVDKAAKRQAVNYGVDVSVDEAGNHVNNIDNRGEPWNDFHDRFLNTSYADMPVKDIAAFLGRSPAAVRSRARVLGLKRGKSKKV